jgi:ketosteroid isomerase-like protein
MTDHTILSQLLDECRRDHEAWINGDGSRYELPDEGTILGAIGGHSRGGAETGRRQSAVAAEWRRGAGGLEYLNGGTDGDLAWLAFIERATVEFVTDPAGSERRWDLRVTEIFHRSDDRWRRVHRHADPLVDRRPLSDTVKLFG